MDLWQSNFALEALTAIKDVLEQIERYVKTLSKINFVVKFFTAGDIINALKSAALRLSQHLVELHIAMGAEQHADLRVLAIELHAQTLAQFSGVQAQLRSLLQSPGGTTPADDANTDMDIAAGFEPGFCNALAAQLHEELQVAQRHTLRNALSQDEKDLLAAAKDGDVGRVQELMLRAAPSTSLDCQDEDGFTLLHLASKSGLTLLVLELLRRGCDVDAPSKNGYTPLHLAALNNNAEVARLLVGGGAAVEARNKKGDTPLHAACRCNEVVIVTTLIGMGANVHARTQNGATPLRVCCDAGGRGAAAVARLLLQKGARADERDAEGCAPLHVACRKASAALVRALVQEGGISVELADTAGRTPLLIAAESGNADAAAALLSLGASVDATTRDGRRMTPLHVAAQYNKREVAEKLLAPEKALVAGKLVEARRAAVDALDQADSTPLHVAAQHGSREVAELLLERGASINAKNRDWLRPVHVAARANQVGVLQLLLVKGAKVDCKTKDNKTPKDLAPVDSQAAAMLQERRPKSSMLLMFHK